jgi:hypothetical protein
MCPNEVGNCPEHNAFGPTDGSGSSPNLNTSGEPVSVKYTALIITLPWYITSEKPENDRDYVSITR